MSTVTAGNNAEAQVAAYLAARGYTIVGRNWKTKFAEVDIVAQKQEVIYFIEVKYRATNQAGDGFDYITPVKLRHMARAAEAWVVTNNWRGPYELLAAAVQGDELTVELAEINF